MFRRLPWFTVVTLLGMSLAAQAAERLSPESLLSINAVSDARLSPDGREVVYTVRRTDLAEDRSDTDLFTVPFEGGLARPLTVGTHSDSSPRFSPDGRYLGFLSDRGEHTQVWLLDRSGGEPFELTDLPGGVSDYVWAPDGASLVVVSRDPKPENDEDADSKVETPPPVVVGRLQFKRDGRGYLDERRAHLYWVDRESKQTRQLTSGPYDDSSPAFAPDGKTVAFVSDRSEYPDLTKNPDVFLVDSNGGDPRRVTANPGADRSPQFSPDGNSLTYRSVVRPERIWYATDHLAVLDLATDEVRILSEALDRNVRSPEFSPDGRAIQFLLEDSGEVHWAHMPSGGGVVERVVTGPVDVLSADTVGDRAALVISRPDLPPEVFGWDGTGEPRQLSFTNQEFLARFELAPVEHIQFDSEGLEIEGFVTRPIGFEAGRRYPSILWIHGGPVSQYSHRFNAVWQLFAAAGYVVVSANPRGSSGYGEEFSHALWANWGGPDTKDVLAAVDYVVSAGLSDPERLGVGGWSYGGILTNYVITQSNRFKAAVSGASETNFLACYGTDHYQHEWETELGLPWENPDLYRKLSPITYVNNINTPTLVMCGEKDWNVPLNQSEQLYQSIRRLGIDTELVIYPGQSHGIRVPSYQKDRYERWVAWFDKYLKDDVATDNSQSSKPQ